MVENICDLKLFDEKNINESELLNIIKFNDNKNNNENRLNINQNSKEINNKINETSNKIEKLNSPIKVNELNEFKCENKEISELNNFENIYLNRMVKLEVVSQYKQQKFSNNIKDKLLKVLQESHNISSNIYVCIYKFDDVEIYDYLKKLSENGINIHLIYHKSILKSLESSENFKITRMEWSDESECQMHCKFILIDKIIYENECTRLVIISSSNFDSDNKTFKNKWDQTMTLLYGHEMIYQKHKDYFNIIEKYSKDIDLFRSYMYENDMNYHDKEFSCYFYPISKEHLFSKKNPVYDLLELQEKMIYFKLNMAYIRDDLFGEYLVNKLKSFKESDIRSVIQSDMTSQFPKFKEKRIFSTHSKNFLISIPSIDECFVITGSTNAKFTDFCKKANHQLLIKENLKLNYIYQHYKSIHYSYKK